MITDKQNIFYKRVLKEILDSNIDLNYNGFILKSLKEKEGSVKDKINSYHLFFKSLGAYPQGKMLTELSSRDFNNYLESIRLILSENKYVLKCDESSFNNVIGESKKTTEFDYFLKRR